MSDLIRAATRSPRLRRCVLGTLFVIATVVLLAHSIASAAPYQNPFWTNGSPSHESALIGNARRSRVLEGALCKKGCGKIEVDPRTGELFVSLPFFSAPGLNRSVNFGLTWRSMVNGRTQLGQGMLPSWEWTANKVVLNPVNPNGPNGHNVEIRTPSGRIDVYAWNGAAYAAANADVLSQLAIAGAGWTRTDDLGSITFAANGMPTTRTDVAGNSIDYTYNGSYQLTGYVDDRDQSYSCVSSASGYLSTLTDYAGRVWTFSHDLDGNLTSVVTPGTPDQPSGIDYGFSYDTLDRLVSFNDGNGETVWLVTYVGATRVVATVLADGEAASYAYFPGRTERTDRLGNVERYFYTGNQITRTDMWLDGTGATAQFVTIYRYAGVFLVNLVKPRGNRIDYMWNAGGHLLQRRHRKTDTSTNDPSDLVHTWSYDASNHLTSRTDAAGQTWTYVPDAGGNITSITFPAVTVPQPQTATVTATYNAYGQKTSVADEKGTATNYGYYGNGPNFGLLQSVTLDPGGLGLTRTFTYDANGFLATYVDFNGNVVTYTHDALGRMTQRQAPAPLSYITKWKYDGSGNITQVDQENRDKDGVLDAVNPWITKTYTWTKTNKIKTRVEEIDATTTRTTSHTYDPADNLIEIARPMGNKIRFAVDPRGLKIKETRGYGDPKAATAENVFDANGNRTKVKSGRGDVVLDVEYDLFDRPIKATDPFNAYTTFEYNRNGQVTYIRQYDLGGVLLRRETRSYDERSRRWRVDERFKSPTTTYADASTVVQHGQVSREILQHTDGRGNLTAYSYDAAHRLATVTDPLGNAETRSYDGNGNRLGWTVVETNGTTQVTHEYEASYDALNRRVAFKEKDRTNSANTLATTFAYDSLGNQVFVVDARGNPTRFSFDAARRMVKRERALATGATLDDIVAAEVTEWGYDANDRVSSHKDDQSNTTQYAYDALDRVASVIDPNSAMTSFVYDADDNITKRTDPAGNVIDNAYDAMSQNTSRTVTLAAGFGGTTSETRTWDALGRMVSVQNNTYRNEFEYTDLGLDSLIHSHAQSFVGPSPATKTVKYTYDSNGNKATEAYPQVLALTYSYNAIDRMSSITDGTNTIAAFTHMGLRPNGATLQNGSTSSTSYTGFRGEQQSIHHKRSNQTTVGQFDYAYDAGHNATYERFGGTGSTGDAFAYDATERVVTKWAGSATPATPATGNYANKFDFAYDDDGNRTSTVKKPWQLPGVTTNYTTNGLYQYSAVGGTTHVWDANGNLTDDGTHTFKYNYRNQVIEIRKKSDSSVVASYDYDARGDRIQKDVGGQKERYILSGAHVVEVYDGSGDWKQSYVFRDRIDGVVMLEQADVLDYDTDGNTTEKTRSFYHANRLGSVMEITDMNEATVATYRYDLYGNPTIKRNGAVVGTDPLGQPWAYSARFLDAESGLQYSRARHYSNKLGRFVQRDPLGHQAGPNLYEYVKSNPANWIDPLGLDRATTQGRFDMTAKVTDGAGVDKLYFSGSTYHGSTELTEDGKPKAAKHGRWILHEADIQVDLWDDTGKKHSEHFHIVEIFFVKPGKLLTKRKDIHKLGIKLDELSGRGGAGGAALPQRKGYCAGVIQVRGTVTALRSVGRKSGGALHKDDDGNRLNSKGFGIVSVKHDAGGGTVLHNPEGLKANPIGDDINWRYDRDHGTSYSYVISWDHCPKFSLWVGLNVGKPVFVKGFGWIYIFEPERAPKRPPLGFKPAPGVNVTPQPKR